MWFSGHEVIPWCINIKIPLREIRVMDSHNPLQTEYNNNPPKQLQKQFEFFFVSLKESPKNNHKNPTIAPLFLHEFLLFQTFQLVIRRNAPQRFLPVGIGHATSTGGASGLPVVEVGDGEIWCIWHPVIPSWLKLWMYRCLHVCVLYRCP